MPAEMTPVLSRDDIAKKVRVLAQHISKDYADRELCIVAVLNGAFIFLADLVRELTIPVRIDFIRLSSYGSAMQSTGNIRITKEIEFEVENRDVLIVEDIVDSGLTIAYVLEHLESFHPRTVKVCTFLDKTERRQTQVPIHYAGHVVE